MTLNDLEFKAEDFDATVNRYLTNPDPYYCAKLVADTANRLLRERLGKASTVYSLPGWSGWHDKPFFRQGFSTASHTARLVCEEEVKRGEL